MISHSIHRVILIFEIKKRVIRYKFLLKPLGVILGAPQEVQYHRPLGLLTEKNLARGKVIDKK